MSSSSHRVASPEPAPDPVETPDPRRWKALFVLAGGLALIVLDGTIVGIALPAIIADLAMNIADAVWVNSLYSMIVAALLLASGWLADQVGRRTTFLGGVALFVLGSVCAGLAPSSGLLIAARALQGLGGALIMPTTVSTVNVLFRGRERAHAFGIWGAAMSSAAAVGPLLGGALTQWFDWRWIFFVNVPLGLVIFALGAVVLPRDRGHRSGLDAFGVALSAVGMASLVFGLIEGQDQGWWTPKGTFALGPLRWPADAPVSIIPVALGVGVLALIVFLVWEDARRRAGRPALLDLRLFAIGTFAWGNLTALAVAVGEFALIFAMPLYLINVLGLSIMSAGWVIAAMAIGAFFAGASARHLAHRIGAPGTVVLGLGLEVVGVVACALVLGVATPAWLVAVCLVVYGLGLGLASAQLTSTVMHDVPPAQSGAASATQSTVRQVGSALGAALSGTLLEAGLVARLPARLAEVQGLPAAVPGQVVDATIASVGGLIPALRSGRGFNSLGQWRLPVGDALARGFADAATWSLWLACAFLVLGLIGSLMVVRASR